MRHLSTPSSVPACLPACLPVCLPARLPGEGGSASVRRGSAHAAVGPLNRSCESNFLS